jgi:hypothetical protein
MSETEKKDVIENGDDVIEFVPVDSLPATSDEFLANEASQTDSSEAVPTVEPDEAMSPTDKLLNRPALPALEPANRARLQMQSPNRLHFYWTVGENPFKKLNKALGSETGSYTLVFRLLDLKRDAEEIVPIDTEGNWWFDVDADSAYRAEVGFYAPNRPFVRVLYSNTVQTPRKSPSPQMSESAEWRVPAPQFAKVLDVAGFKQDAFDVAITGDDTDKSDNASYAAFAKFSGRKDSEFTYIDPEELRYALLSVAAGAVLEQLRFRISRRVFELLQGIRGGLSKDDALAALKSEFEIDAEEFVETEQEFGPGVFGASLVHFPQRVRGLRTRPRGFDKVSKFEPVSSGSGAGLFAE